MTYRKLEHVGAFRAAWHVILTMALLVGAWGVVWWWLS